jgi:hypothetical protein
MTPHCKSAGEALAASPLSSLIDQARQLDRISAVVASISQETVSSSRSLPPLHCSLQGRTLIITVGTPSQAAKLRQRASALQQAVGERVPEITGIRVRLQPSTVAEPISGSPGAGVPAQADAPEQARQRLNAALRFADDLARELHDSPLRRAARRLYDALRAKLDDAR